MRLDLLFFAVCCIVFVHASYIPDSIVVEQLGHNETVYGSALPCHVDYYSFSSLTSHGNYSIDQLSMISSGHLTLSVSRSLAFLLSELPISSLNICSTNSSVSMCMVPILCDLHSVDDWIVAVASKENDTVPYRLFLRDFYYTPIVLDPSGTATVKNPTPSPSPSPTLSKSITKSSSTSTSITQSNTSTSSTSASITQSNTSTTTASISRSKSFIESIPSTSNSISKTQNEDLIEPLPLSLSFFDFDTTNDPTLTSLLAPFLFFSFEVGEITPDVSEIFLSFSSHPIGQIENAYVNKDNIALPYHDCFLLKDTGLIGNGDVFIIDRCILQEGTWILTVLPKPGLKNLTVTSVMYSPTIQSIVPNTPSEEGELLVGSLQHQTQTDFYALTSAYCIDDQLSLRVFIEQVQGGELELSVEFDSVPYSACSHLHANKLINKNVCNADIGGCIVTIPFCQIEEGEYNIGIRVMTQYTASIPVTYVIGAEWVYVPTSIPIQLDTLIPGKVTQAQYLYYQFDSSTIGELSWLDIHLYVDAQELGFHLIDMFIGYKSSDSLGSCSTNYKSCSVSSETSCTIQLTSCDLQENSKWNLGIFGNEAPFEALGELSFTLLLRSKIAIPLGLSPPSQQFLSSRIYPNMYDQYRVTVSQGELYEISISLQEEQMECPNCILTAYFATSSLAGNSCTTLCYSSFDEKQISVGNPVVTAQLYLCSGLVLSEEMYIGIIANHDIQEPISYTIELKNPNDRVIPSESLHESAPPVYYTLEGNTSQNFTVTLGNPVSDKYMVLYAFLEPLFEYEGVLTLSLYNGYKNYMFCPGESLSCTMQHNETFCSIVVPYCEYKQYDGITYAEVKQELPTIDENHEDSIQFGIGYYSRPVDLILLNNNEPVANILSQHTYDHYVIQGEAYKSLVATVYTDHANGDSSSIFLFASTKGLAGKAPCYTFEYVCKSKSQCDYVVNACELDNVSYYLSVYTDSHSPSFIPLQYTIEYFFIDPVVPIPVNSALTSRVHDTQQNFYTISFDSLPVAGQYSYLLISSVRGGDISISVSPNNDPVASCPCFYTGTLGDTFMVTGEAPATVFALSNCLVSVQNFTVQVQQNIASHLVSNGKHATVEYTIGVSSVIQPVDSLVFNNTYAISSPDLEYRFFAYETEKYSRPILYISDVDGGSLTGLYSALSPPSSSSCDEPHVLFERMRADGQFPLPVQCNDENEIEYISTYSRTITKQSVSFTLSIKDYPTISLLDDVPLTLSIDSHIYRYFMYDASPLVSITDHIPIITITVEGSNLYLALLEGTMCGSVVSFSDCQRNSTVCTISLSYCDLRDGLYYLELFSSIRQDISVRLQVNQLADLNEEIVLPYQTEIFLSPSSWSSFSFPSPLQSEDDSLRSSITMSVNGTQPEMSYKTNDFAASFPCLDDACFGDVGCTIIIPSCCVTTGTYYISIFNPTIEFQNYTINLFSTIITQTEWIDLDSTVSINQRALISELEYDLPETRSQLSYLIIDVYNATNPFSMYIQFGSFAGSQTAYFVEHSCVTGYINFPCELQTSCQVQYFHFQPEGLLTGRMYAALTVADRIEDENLQFMLASKFVDSPPILPLNQVYGPTNIRGFHIVQIFALNMTQGGNAFENLFINVTVSMGSISAFIASTEEILSLYSFDMSWDTPSASGCYANTTITSCSFERNLCNGDHDLHVVVVNQNVNDTTTSFSLYTYIQDTPYQTLQLGDSLPIFSNISQSENFLLHIPSVESREEIVTISIVGLVGSINMFWCYGTSGYCFEQSQSIVCSDDNPISCDFILTSCTLHVGDYFIHVNSEQSDFYVIQSSIVQPSIAVVDSIEFAPFYLEIPQNSQEYFSFNLTKSSLFFGHGLDISLDETNCGELSMYVNLGSIAGRNCHINNETRSLSLSWCDIITQNLFGEYFITIRGNIAPYSDIGVPVTANLIIQTLGGGFGLMRSILPNQRIQIDSTTFQSNWFIMGVASLEGYAGETIVSVSGSVDGSATLYIGFDLLSSPLCRTYNESEAFLSCSTNANANNTCSLSFNSCSMSQHSFLYIGIDHIERIELVVHRIDPLVQFLSLPKNTTVIDVPSFSLQVLGTITPTNSEHYFLDLNEEYQVLSNLYIVVKLSILDNSENFLSLLYSSRQVPASSCAESYCTVSRDVDGYLSCSLFLNSCEIKHTKGLYLTVVDSSSPTDTVLSTTNDLVAPVITEYRLDIKSTVESITLEPNVPVCATVSPKEMIWFTVDGGQETIANSTVQSLRFNTNEGIDPISIFLNSRGIADDFCYDEMYECKSNEECIIYWDCGCQLSLSVHNFRFNNSLTRTQSTFTVEWIQIPVTFLDIPNTGIQYPECCEMEDIAAQFFRLKILRDEPGYYLIEFTTQDPLVVMYTNIGSVPGYSCSIQHCLSSCSLIQACTSANTIQDPSDDYYYYHITETSHPYTITATFHPLLPIPLQLGEVVTHSVNSDRPTNIYLLDLTEKDAIFPSSLSIELQGIHEGTLNVWISEDIFGDISCSVASFSSLSSFGSILISEGCFPIAGYRYYITVELAFDTNSCSPLYYNLYTIWESGTSIPILLNITSTISEAIAYETEVGKEIVFQIDVSEDLISLDSVLLISVSGIEQQITTAFIHQTLGDQEERKPDRTKKCFQQKMTKDETYILSSWLRESTIYIRVIGIEEKGPETRFAISARLEESLPLRFNSPNVIDSNSLFDWNALHFFSLHKDSFTVEENSFVDTFALSVSLQVWKGTAASLDIYFFPSGSSSSLHLISFDCYEGPCIIPFTEAYTTTTTFKSGYFQVIIRLEYGTALFELLRGEEGNCIPYVSSLCPEAHSILQFGEPTYYDNEIIRVYNELYEKFHCGKGCSCLPIQALCQESLVRLACESVLPICESITGLEAPICRSTCYDVEEFCLLSWSAAGLPRYNCGSSRYGTCNASSTLPLFSSISSSSGEIDGTTLQDSSFTFDDLPTGVVLGSTIACFVLLFILMVLIYAVVRLYRNSERYHRDNEDKDANEPLLYLGDEDEEEDDQHVSVIEDLMIN